MRVEESDIGADVFRKVLSYYPTGVSVVTGSSAGDGPVGLVVGTFTSLSLEPALVSFMPAKSSTSWPKIRSSGAFCVNVLGVDQAELCRQFSAPGGRKFEGVDWRPGATGSPILSGSVAWVDCWIEQVFDSGDHQIVVGRVVDLRVESDELPMTFLRGGYAQLQLPQLSAAPEATAAGVEVAPARLAEEVADLLGLDAFEAKAWVESREQIVERLLIGFLEVLLDRFGGAVDGEGSADEQLQSLIRVSMESLRDYAAAAILFQSERAGLTPGTSARVRDLEQAFRGHWKAVIERGVSAGAFDPDIDPRMAQQFLCDAIFSTARWYHDGGRLKRREVEDMYAKFAVNAVSR
jgi:3-hydroxy-9,10-secoandrosta-1,3,5(10)-triene-9,17-dione monooxygenase reductase component